jgi:hypothetical protein
MDQGISVLGQVKSATQKEERKALAVSHGRQVANLCESDLNSIGIRKKLKSGMEVKGKRSPLKIGQGIVTVGYGASFA